MNNILSHTLTVLLVQPITPPPPMPPPPPVGDVVPLDGNIWVLMGFALIIGALAIYFNRKKAL